MPEALILTGPNSLEAALRSASKTHVGIILEPQAIYRPDTHDQIRAHAGILGTQLYLPPQFAEDAPNSRILIDCSPLGSPLVNRLRTHRKCWGRRTAALIRPVALKITLPLHGSATINPLTLSELASEQSALFSEESGCSYLIREAEDELSFLLFSTEQSVQWQLELCRQLEIEPLIIARHTEE